MLEIVSANPSAKSCVSIEQLLIYITRENKSLFEANKAKFIEFYDKIVLSTRGQLPASVKRAFVPLLRAVTVDDFKDKFLPVVQRQVKRSPDCLDTISHLMAHLAIDFNEFAPAILTLVKDYIQASDEAVRKNSAALFESLVSKTSSIAVITQLLDVIVPIVETGSSNWYARYGIVKALAAVGQSAVVNKAEGADKEKLFQKVLPALQKVLEKESNKDCFQVILSAVAAWVHVAPLLISEKLAQLLVKGTADKDLGQAYLHAIWDALCDLSTIKAAGDAKPAALNEKISALFVKPLLQFVTQSKTKIAIATEAVLSFATLVVLASVDSKIDAALETEKAWAFMLGSESHYFSSEWFTKQGDNVLSVIVGTIQALVSHHFQRIDTGNKSFFKLLLTLLTSEKHKVRSSAISTIEALHGVQPVLAERLLDSFQNEIVPSFVLPAGHYSDDKSPRLATILAAALRTIVSKSLSIQTYLPSLLILSFHPLISRSRKPKLLAQVTKKLGTTVEAVSRDHADLIVSTLLGQAGFSSTDRNTRRAATLAIGSLVRDANLASRLLLPLVPLLNPDVWFGLSKEEVGVLRTAPGKVFKVLELDEYIPELKLDKNYKDEDAEAAARKKLMEERRKQQAIVDEKMKKLEAAQLIIENKIRERVTPIYNNLRTALEVVTVAARESPQAFEINDAIFLFSSFDKILSIATRPNDLQDLAALAVTAISSRCVPNRFNRALLTRALLHSDYHRGVIDAERRQITVRAQCDMVDNIVRHIGKTVEPRTWAVLQQTITSVFTQEHRHELQDMALQELGRNLKFANAIMVKCLLSTLDTLPGLADEALAILGGVALTLSSTSPLHQSAIVPLLENAASHVNHEVRRACLTTIMGIADLESFGLHRDVVLSLWIAKFDADADNSALASSLYDLYVQHGHTLPEDYLQHFSKLLAHENSSVRGTVARALAGAVNLYPATQIATFEHLFALYRENMAVPADAPRDFKEPAAHLQVRSGVAVAIREAAGLTVATEELINMLFRFLVDTAIFDPNMALYEMFLEAGIQLINSQGAKFTSVIHPMLDAYLAGPPPQTEKQHRARQSVVVFLGSLIQHLQSTDPRTESILAKLLEVLHTPSEPVQRSVANCLASVIPQLQDSAEKLLRSCLDMCLTGEDYGDRRGGAYGIAGIIKGLKHTSLRKYPFLMEELEKASANKNSEIARQGASLAFECLSLMLGRHFEPWVIKILQQILNGFGDSSANVRESTTDAAKAIMSQLSGNGVNVVLPVLLRSLDSNDKSSKWRMKTGAIELLGTMAFCQPEQLGQLLPTIVPKLSALLTDTHNQVQKSAKEALNAICGTIRNPEISKIVPKLLKALDDPDFSGGALDALANTQFVNRIDPPSLSLIMPILDRALRDRHTETKKKATKIVGSMCSLTDPISLKPYQKSLLEQLKVTLADPIPQTRSIAASALGLLVKGMDVAGDVIPWLLEAMKSEGGTIERSGAAQGLAQVISTSMDLTTFKLQVLPKVLQMCSSPSASARQGNLHLFQYLPETIGMKFESMLSSVLPTIVAGLADDTEMVRDAALKAGQAIVGRFGDADKIDLIIPTLLKALFDDNWRIRHSSVQLLGDLLYQVSGAADNFATKDISVLLDDKSRCGVLAALYLLRFDLNITVRQTAAHVWKMLVVNTPKTLRAVMPTLMEMVISQLSTSEERREVASKTLGELVEKIGDRILPDILPILINELTSTNAQTRVGVCLGFSEVLAAAGHATVPFFDMLLPAIRTALCDSEPLVREASARAFDELYKVVGEKTVDEILPPLLAQMENPDHAVSEAALHGLQQILAVRSALVLPSIIPKLTTPPLTPFNARALASIAEVSKEAFNQFLGPIVPILVKRIYGGDADVSAADSEQLATAAQRILSSLAGRGLSIAFTEIYKFLQENNPALRVGAVSLLDLYCKNAKNNFDEHIPNLIQVMLRAYNDPYQKVNEAALAALSSVMAAVPKEDTSKNYVQVINDTIDGLHLADTLAGFNLPGGLSPILPMYLQVLRTGSQEEREQASMGIRYMLEKTDQSQLKPYLQQITGPLIRILAERTLNSPTRISMLQTLNMVVTKGAVLLRPFAAQLQTTYVKSLSAASKIVRDLCGTGIGLLLTLGAKPEFLFKDLIRALKDQANPAPDACLNAMTTVMLAMDAAPSEAATEAIRDAAEPLLSMQDPILRLAAAKTLGVSFKYSSSEDVADVFRALLVRGDGDMWLECEGGVTALYELLMLQDPSKSTLCAALHEVGLLFPYLTDMLKHFKSPVRAAAVQAICRVMVLLQNDEKLVADLVEQVTALFADESSDVRVFALNSVKAFAKECPGLAADHLSILVPPILLRVKDKRVLPVKYAAERCLLHVLQVKLDPNLSVVQHYASTLKDKLMAQQIVEYTKKVLSKMPQFSDEDTYQGDDMEPF
jgi:HEAT repeat protein